MELNNGGRGYHRYRNSLIDTDNALAMINIVYTIFYNMLRESIGIRLYSLYMIPDWMNPIIFSADVACTPLSLYLSLRISTNRTIATLGEHK